MSGLPGFQEQLTVAGASGPDAATAIWEGLPHELRERAVLRCSTGCLRIFGSEGERPRSRRAVLCGARGAVLLLLRAAAHKLELREKNAGCAAAARAAELRYPCAPPLYCLVAGASPDAFLRDDSGGDEAPLD